MARQTLAYFDQAKSFTCVRRDLPEWAALSLQVGRGVLRRVDRAFQSFYPPCARGGSNGRHKRVRSLSFKTNRNRVRNRNLCHEMTTALVRRYGLIAMEDLEIANVTRSTRGTV